MYLLVAKGFESTEADVPTEVSMRQRYHNRGRYRGTEAQRYSAEYKVVRSR